MTSIIVSYQKIITDGPNGTTIALTPPLDADGHPQTTELATIDGTTYVAVPEGVTLPAQPKGITTSTVTLDTALKAQIIAASPIAQLVLRRHPNADDAPPSKPPASLWAQRSLQTFGLATADDLTSAALRLLAARRYRAEIAGTTWNGHPVATDRQSQGLITGAVVAAQLPGFTSVDWKMMDGTFVTLSAANIIAIAKAVKTHVQAAFDNEKTLAAKVRADISTSIETGWPS